MTNAEQKKQLREKRKKAGLCTECNLIAVQNRTKCENHLNYHNELTLRVRSAHKEQGLCSECSEKAVANNGKCEFHRVHHLKRLKKTRNALRRAWKLANRCIRCGVALNPEMDCNFVQCLNCRIEKQLPLKRSDFKF